MARHEHLALWALAAGELDADERSRVEAHVGVCAECARALAQVRRSRAALHDARGVTPVVQMDAVGERLREEAARRLERPHPGARWPRAVGLAGACAAMLALWWLRVPAGDGGNGVAMVTERPNRVTGPQSESAGADTARAALEHGATGAAPLIHASPSSVALREPAQSGVETTADVEPAHGSPGGAMPSGSIATAPTHQGPMPAAPRDAVQERVTLVEAERVATLGAVLRDSGGQERALEPGMRLQPGTAVRTPARASAVLRLPDASRVRLSEGSEVELSRSEPRDVHLIVKEGRLSVEASHVARHGFLVEAAGLRVSVVGTVFTVERTKDGAAVAVAEGQVRVETEGQPPRQVGPGERVEFHVETHALRQRKVSKPDLRAFGDLRAPAIAAPSRPSRPAVPQPARPRSPEAPAETPPTSPGAMAAVTPGPLVAPEEAPMPEPAPPPAHALAPVGAAGSSAMAFPAAEDPAQEFAPYPAPSVNPPSPTTPKTPVDSPPETVAKQAPTKREPLIPPALVSGNADERFLGYARLQVNSRRCESFLLGLEEIAERSRRAAHREQARYLRARCFEEKLESHRAREEYRQYLQEFPRGRYIKEARTALLP